MILERLSYDEVFSLDGLIFQETLVAKLNDGYPIEGKHLQSLREHPQLLLRLSKMSAHHINEDELGTLANILERCPNVRSLALKLANYCVLTSLEKNPQLLQRMTVLCMYGISYDEDKTFLKSIHELFPNLEYLALGFVTCNLGMLKSDLSGIWPFAKLKVDLCREEPPTAASVQT